MPTNISWVTNPDGTKGETWNPVHGCTKISTGCKNCYAERMSKRLAGRHGYPPAPDNFKVTLRPDRLEQPLKWRKPRRIFVCSMSDLFHGDVSDEFIARVWSIMYQAPRHTFQVLTKRPQRLLDFLSGVGYWEGWWTHNGTPPEKAYRGTGIVLGAGKFAWPLNNVWLGVTVENQATADERIPLLLQTPAAVRFVSAEPLLSNINLGFGPKENCIWCSGTGEWYADTEEWLPVQCECMTRNKWLDLVITGGETGPGARPMHPDWARGLRDQCQAAGVKFHFKQFSADRKNHNVFKSFPPDLQIRQMPDILSL